LLKAEGTRFEKNQLAGILKQSKAIFRFSDSGACLLNHFTAVINSVLR